MSSRRRVAFLQIPPVRPGGERARENHPMAAAYLAGYAIEKGLGDRSDFAIAPREVADEGSDEAIVRAVAALHPDVLGLSLYVWNVTRSLAIAARVREAVPDVLVVGGGPEVVPERPEIFGPGGIDVGVQGEGEVAFAALLDARGRGRDLGEGPGLVLPPRDGRPTATHPAARISSLDTLPSPYLDGWIDPGPDRFLYLETARGCAFRCTFCRYDADSGGPVVTLGVPRVEATLEFARSRGVREVFCLDPTLNQRRDAKEVLRAIARANPGRRMRLGGELVAELVDDETADLLAAAGFDTVEAGLQSIHEPTLKAVRRVHHRERFLAGVRRLRARGVRCRVDLIIGLPEETPDSFRRAVDFVRDEGLADDIQVFDLLVLPGTALHRERARLGLVHRPYPPYAIVRTPTMTEDDLLAAGRYAEETLGIDLNPRPRRRRYRPEERLVLPPHPAPADFDRVRRHPRRFLALEAEGPLALAADAARRALAPWLRANPFASLDVILRPPRPADPAPLEALVESLQAAPATLGAQVYRRVFVVLPAGGRAFPASWRRRASRFALVRSGAT